MKPFTTRRSCQSGIFCRVCRADRDWRQRVGAPAICPAGPNGRPRRAEAPVDRVRMERQLALCRRCEDFNGEICERLGGCRATFRRRISEAAFVCPRVTRAEGERT